MRGKAQKTPPLFTPIMAQNNEQTISQPQKAPKTAEDLKNIALRKAYAHASPASLDDLTVDELASLEKQGRIDPADIIRASRPAQKKVPEPQVPRQGGPEETIPIPRCRNPPEMAPMWPEKKVQTFFLALKNSGVTGVLSVPRHPLDPRYKKEKGGNTGFACVNQFFSSIGKDKDMFSAIATVNSKFGVGVVNLYRTILEETNNWVTTNGPFDGLAHRLALGLQRPKPRFDPARYLPFVLAAMPMDKKKIRDLRGLGAKEISTWVKSKANTSYGFPFCEKKVTSQGISHMDQMRELGGVLLHHIAEGTIEKYARENLELFLVALRNKMESYELSKLHQKIRPIYVFPAHLQFLWSAIWQNLADSAIRFDQDPTSSNAHGFSWANGGGQRLYDWILWASKQPPGLYCIAYSDDNLWVVVCCDGTVYRIDLDAAMLDMSLSRRFGTLARLAQDIWMEGKLDKTWTGVATLNAKQAFVTTVVVSNALTFVFADGLRSGVSGTAEFDQIASSAAIGLAKTIVVSPRDLAHATELVSEAVKATKAQLGIEFKEDTIKFDQFRPDEDEYPGLFLGMKLVKSDGYYVPVRPLEKVIRSLVSPKAAYGQGNQVARVRALMERARGIMVSGGWYYEPLYDAVRVWYTAALMNGYEPAPESDDTFEENILTWEAACMKIKFPSVEFQEREWFRNLYAPPGMARPMGAVEVGKERGPDPLAGMYSAEMDPSALDHGPGDPDKGAVNIADPHPTTAEKMGRLQPMTKAQRANYRELKTRAFRSAQAGGRGKSKGVVEKAAYFRLDWADMDDFAEDQGDDRELTDETLVQDMRAMKWTDQEIEDWFEGVYAREMDHEPLTDYTREEVSEEEKSKPGRAAKRRAEAKQQSVRGAMYAGKDPDG
nr:MAG: RNA-dependent RNA polymerase [Permutotetraviridae sp.]